MLRDGETFEVKGLTFRMDIEADPDIREPWKHEDGHGPVRDPGRRLRDPYTGATVKRPGERPMDNGRGDVWLYDWQAAMKQARDESWGIDDDERARLAQRLQREPTRGEVIARAVEMDFQRLRAWLRDDWWWVGVVVTLLDTDEEPTDYRDSLWGIESDSDAYHEEVARDLAEQIAQQIGKRKTLTKSTRIRR